MENFKVFESHEGIDIICKKYNIKNFTINDDGSIDVNQNVDLDKRGLTKFPLKFRNVSGNFYCYDNKLTSLKGGPKNVGGVYSCRYNQLTSLEGSPQIIGGAFNCSGNQLTSLEGFPENLGGNLFCVNNPIFFLIGSWMNNDNRDSMVEYFNDLDIIRDNGKSIILDRLEDFISIFNVVIDLNEVGKHYTIV